MRSVYIGLAISCALLGSCNAFKTDQAIEYNDWLVDQIDNSVDEVVECNNTFYSGTYEEASEANTNLKKQLDERIASVEIRESFDNNDYVKDAALGWLRFYRHLCDEDFQDVVDYMQTAEFNEDDEAWIDDKIQTALDGEDEHMDKFAEEQEVFGDKYNFVIEETDEYDY